jgi:hypothetical protein
MFDLHALPTEDTGFVSPTLIHTAHSGQVFVARGFNYS